jgi:hypothetical protein
MSTTDTSFSLSLAGAQQQALAALKETQEYTLRVAEVLVDHPALRASQGIPSPAELVDAGFATASQALDLQREFVAKLASTVAGRAG